MTEKTEAERNRRHAAERKAVKAERDTMMQSKTQTGGLLLVHDRDLLGVLDDWVATLAGQDFIDVLPLLRRTFGEYSAPERANIAAAVKRLAGGAPGPARRVDDSLDAVRAAGVLRTVAAILGAAR